MMKLFLLLPLLLCAGCSRFRTEKKADRENWYAERITVPRTHGQLERKELVLALYATLESREETEALEAILKKDKIRLKIIRIADRDRLPPMVRAGRADLIAGAFTPAEIRAFHLLPVLPYTGTDGKTQYCLAARYQDDILETMLGKVPPPDEEPKKGKKHD